MPIDYAAEIATEMKLDPKGVTSTIRLLDEDATVPFIARYRKEATGSLDDLQITGICDRLDALRKLDARKATILKTIEEQGKLTDELKGQIEALRNATELEDLYLPYRPKRKTRATVAIQRGLGPLADLIWAQEPFDGQPDTVAADFVDPEKEVPDVAAAWAGANDIVAERVSETASLRAALRELYQREGRVVSRVRRGKQKEGAKFKDYFDFAEPAGRIPSHRMLAIRRGESEGVLSFRIEVDRDKALGIVGKMIVHNENAPLRDRLVAACEDGYDRLLTPSIEGHTRNTLRERADREAISVFATNLRKLLMTPPLGGKWTLGVDPGLRTGCKLVSLDGKGDLLAATVIYPLGSRMEAEKAAKTVEAYCHRYRIEAVAVGNGTGGRETERFFRELDRDQINDAEIVMVSEAGASVYSASDAARKEFPDQDVTVRGAISIGRRLQDPLAELVKIEPKAIGVGQYQHDVEQNDLKKSLDDVVVSCVNAVGVEINTASEQLLSYVAGLNAEQARHIVSHRSKAGAFLSRKQLLDVPRVGPKTFEQAAGFLRIRGGSNPLDASAVHPERYGLVETMAGDLDTDVTSLIGDATRCATIDINAYINDDVGEPTLRDILQELAKPGRDPRESFDPVRFDPDVTKIDHLNEGMVLEGVVTNVTNFGAFVDIGVHQDGLVHVSELSHDFVEDPAQVIEVGRRTKVKVIEVDLSRRRISLSVKQTTEPPPRPKRQAPPRKDQPSGRSKGKPSRQRDRGRDTTSRGGPPKFNPFADLYMENGVIKKRNDNDK